MAWVTVCDLCSGGFLDSLVYLPVTIVDDLAFPLSLVTYDKRFFGYAGGAMIQRLCFSLIIGYLL